MSLIPLLLILLALFFIVIHLRPLNAKEIVRLSKKRRNRKITSYFSFNPRKYSVNKEFKSNLKANGKFYHINENLDSFPSVVASLLKYKKHEWIVVSFEKQKKIELLWVNKGLDRTKVSLYLPLNEIINLGQASGYSSFLIFHNHPNPDPNSYCCNKPSNADILSAKSFAENFNKNGFNLLEFICERGQYYPYYSSISNSFLPIHEFIDQVNNENGKSRLSNFFLHLEKWF